MKSLIFIFSVFCLVLIGCGQLFGQVFQLNNNPTAGAFLGWNAGGVNGNLDFRTNNINRMRLQQTGTTTIDGYLVDNSGFLSLSMVPGAFNLQSAYSLLHLNGFGNSAFGPQALGYRSWMRPGITFTHNSDLMYIGPRANDQDITDAVIAWSDNDQPGGGLGPDVLRFLFTSSGNGATNISTDVLSDNDWDGVEIARMMGDARMGVGPRWTNTILPKRALDVVRRNDDLPQFRITHTPNLVDTLGIFTDFQTSPFGNLHIVPRESGVVRNVAIGFFHDPTPGSTTNPANPSVLDVGGTVRVRNLPDLRPQALIMGYSFADINQNDTNDHFLGRIDLLHPDTASCFFLNGVGQWSNVCDSTFADCDWEYDNTNVWTAHGSGCYPKRSVFIGSSTGPDDTKLYITRNDSTDNGVFNAVEINWSNASEEANSEALRGIVANILGTPDMDQFLVGTEFYLFGDQVGVGHQLRVDARLGIGSDFNIQSDPSTDSSDVTVGHRVRTFQGFNNYGVDAYANLSANITAGGKFFASEGKYTVGVWGECVETAQDGYGLYGKSTGLNTGGDNIGVYGEASNGTFGNYAFYAAGTPTSTTPPLTLSDESVKTNISTIDNASDLINQMQPRSYSYIQDGNESLHLNEGLHFGFIAQELQPVLPEVVAPFYHPAQFDTLGNELSPRRELLGIKYNDIIPILVEAVKESNGVISEQAGIIENQSAQLEAQAATIAELESKVEAMEQKMESMFTIMQSVQTKTNNCCSFGSAQEPNDGSTGSLPAPTDAIEGVKLMQNVPNPFDTTTRIDFILPADANVVLELSDVNGRPLRRLIDGQMNAGSQSIVLNGSSLAPGTYFYTVYANGEMITKKMVKK